MSQENKTIGLFNNYINQKTINKLENDNVHLVKFPEVKKSVTILTDLEETLISNISKFDWLVFTDVYSVEFFIDQIKQVEFDLFDLDNVRVCAFGEAVADRLRFVQLHSDVIADKLDSEIIFKQLSDYFLGFDEFDRLHFLFVKEINRNYKLIEYLNKQKSDVSVLNIYSHTKIDDATKFITLTKSGAFDEFVLNSAEEVTDLSSIFYPQDLSEVFKNINVIATNEIVFQVLKDIDIIPKFSKKRG